MEFDTRTGVLPTAPADHRLVTVTFDSCPSSNLAMHYLAVEGGNTAVDRHGLSSDSWWVIQCTSLPNRTFRLYRGTASMSQLLRRYGFLDSTGCVNHQRARAHFASTTAVKEQPPTHLSAVQREAVGVPQFFPNSGVCWFATMCYTTFMNPEVRSLVCERLPPEIRVHAERCNHDRASAEAFRKAIWHTYGVGDDVDDRPENDGCNGFSEFCVLCAKLGIPVVRYTPQHGSLKPLTTGCTLRDKRHKTCTLRQPTSASEPHLLVLRFQDGDHSNKYPLLRRVKCNGVRYRLAGLYMGQKKCGHQIGAASPTGHWRDWSITDADLHKDGIGPVHIRFDGVEWKEDWWRAWKDLVHVTKFGANGSDLCNLSPWNPCNTSLDKYRGASGTNSVDALYTSCLRR
jgi:hypothetical protein